MYRLLLIAVLFWLALPVTHASGSSLPAADRTSTLIGVTALLPRILRGKSHPLSQGLSSTVTALPSTTEGAATLTFPHQPALLQMPEIQLRGDMVVASRVQASSGDLEEQDGTERPNIPLMSIFAVILLSFIILIAVARTLLIRRL